MNARIAKKKEKKEALKSSMVYVTDRADKNIYVFIDKRIWNVGDKKLAGYMMDASTGDYIAFEKLILSGYRYVAHIDRCHRCHVHIRKSWDNKNHVITTALIRK